MLAAAAAGVVPPVGEAAATAAAPGACMMQSCQTRSGRMTAADLLISADDILYGLPRSFDGDSGTVSGGVIIDL
uniref:Putative secreted peptide n=1 Tax=Anopheles braziliensis TaxID=58242 RepID=A0A2M3ZX33_9DIPT